MPLPASLQLDLAALSGQVTSASADPWVRDYLPAQLLKHGPAGLAWWQWLALPLLGVLAVLVGRGFSFAARLVLKRTVLRAAPRLAADLLELARGPLRLWGAIFGTGLLLPFLELPPGPQGLVVRLLKVGVMVAFFWAVLRLVSLASRSLAASEWSKRHPAAMGLLPLATRIAQVGTYVVAAIAVLSEFGYPMASILAGLGIGGLALALAAQKTVENLFGSIAISFDQPFRAGDLIHVDGTTGVVEFVGLRSTRIRTLDRTVVTIPNGKLADLKSETLSGRDRFRLNCRLGLSPQTSAGQMRTVLADLESALRAHPKIWPEELNVHFAKLEPSALEIGVEAWFQTTSLDEFRFIRQEMLVRFMEIAERAGTKVAAAA